MKRITGQDLRWGILGKNCKIPLCYFFKDELICFSPKLRNMFYSEKALLLT